MKQSVSTETASPFRPPPSSKQTMDHSLEVLSANRQVWVDLPIDERIELVEACRLGFAGVWDRWVEYSLAAKGTKERFRGNDREWLEIAPINRLLTVLLRSLSAIRAGRRPLPAGGYRMRPNGQVAADVYPDNFVHSLVFRNMKMEVWLEPDVSLEEALLKQAAPYFEPGRAGKVALVLGAGNAASLPSSDLFHKLFSDLRVVLLKMNPVNSYLGPLMEEAYHSLIDRGFLQIVYGGVEEGNYLVNHDLVDEVHMTGSDRTFDAIVFGSGEEGRRRKAAGTPLVTKPVQGELGCITPWIIVPGDWSESEVRFQAARMAFWMMRHEGYICFAPRIVVLKRDWPQRQAFLDALLDSLAQVEPIRAYYPGSAETQQLFVQEHPEAIQIGGGLKQHVPWTLIPGLDPTNEMDICFRHESFSGMCGEVTLEAQSIPDYLEQAVEFLNRTVWGTLSATIMVSEESMADPVVGPAVELAIEDLRYGTVALNGPGTFGFYTMLTPWGGFPGSAIEDIQSGTCKVTNFLMLHRPQKSIVRAPFSWWPYPFLGTARNLDVFSQKLALFEVDFSLRRLPGLFWSALRT